MITPIQTIALKLQNSVSILSIVIMFFISLELVPDTFSKILARKTYVSTLRKEHPSLGVIINKIKSSPRLYVAHFLE